MHINIDGQWNVLVGKNDGKQWDHISSIIKTVVKPCSYVMLSSDHKI